MNKTLSIIIPIYNEEKTIIDILKKIKSLTYENFKLEIIVIDDKSSDSSLFLLQKNEHLFDKLILNKKNMGKGFAVKEGLLNARGEYIIFQDADNEYDPKDFNKFIDIYENFDADLIIGSRINYDQYSSSGNFFNKIGNFIITNFFNILFNTTFTDIYSCYLSFKKDKLDINSLRTYGFQQQAEILTKITNKCDKKFEVKINYNGRSHKEGKKIRYYHIFGVIYEILRGYLFK